MSDMMNFPETWEEYEKLYGFNDSEEIYTNNSRLIQSFRVKQWLDHIAQKETKQQAIKASDCISRQDAITSILQEADKLEDNGAIPMGQGARAMAFIVGALPPAEPERLTDDDFETIRIHLNAYKEKLCNQRRWEEAEEYQRIIDRFMSFASAESKRKKGKWLGKEQFANSPEFYSWQCSMCGCVLEDPTLDKPYPFCPNCGADMREGEQSDPD